MSNLEKYTQVFIDVFNVNKNMAKTLKYQEINAWDSIGHMGLIGALEEAFDIIFETNDIIDFSSYEKGMEILEKYNVAF